jgi:hypothetical protein
MAGCPDHLHAVARQAYPQAATRENLKSGFAEVEFTLDGSQIRNVKVLTASHPAFVPEALALANALHCHGGPKPVQVRIPIEWHSD